MRRRRADLRLLLAGALGLLVLLVLSATLVGREARESPAPTAVLNEIGERNREAAIDAAARFKEEAAAATRAAELAAETNRADPTQLSATSEAAGR
ncbi:hypothetical protein [Sphingosinicella terrae]|uniref:hypothetical protein n=1 Tax=Sphingosinicella terrae TaxID=2172047 RepID=UPI000E0D7608|nr:hypothetical protein [Sphingosinicella terrae]